MSNIRFSDQLFNTHIPPWSGSDLARVTQLVAHLRRLGDRPLLEFFIELVGGDDDARIDIELNLERYARAVSAPDDDIVFVNHDAEVDRRTAA